VPFRGLARSGCAALWASLALASLGCNLISADRSDGPNVLLVTIDTLRADRVGAYGARDVATPTLDALAARGVLFEQAMAAVPLTLPSHASLLTGQYPATHGVRHNAVFVLGDEAETLAERFAEAGYATGAVMGAAVLDRDFGLAQGFEFYDAEMPTERASAAGFYERSAKAVTDRALTWLAGERGPFFLWVHYYDVHAKYSPPEPFKTRFQRHPYDGEAAFVDQELGRLLAALESEKRLANTVVAVTADHGEGLGEHGEESHTYFIYDSVLHVPMILAGPGLPAGKRIAPVAPNTALAPTLLALAGVPPLAHTDASDLAPLWRQEVAASTAGEAYAESLAGELDHGWAPIHAIRSDRFHYIRAPRPELFDLASDPRQRRNLLPSQAPEHVAAVEAGEARIAALLAGSAEANPLAVDAETRAQVEALGYVVPDGRAVKNGADPKDVHKLAGAAFDALALLFAKRHEDAEKLALKGLEVMPQSSQLHDILARIYLDTRRPALALPHALAAARLNPQLADFHAQVAYIHLLLGDLPNAVATFEHALRVDPKHPGAHIGAMWRAKLGATIEGTEEHARRALEYGGDRAAVVERVGEVWEGLGEYERALAVFERGAKEHPDHEPFHMRLAIQFARLGDDERAERERAAAGKAAADVNLRNRLGIAYAARRDFTRAEPIFRDILAERPDEPSTRRFLARMLRETGREAEAAKLVEGVAPAHEVLPPEPPTAAPARG
jgi:arylsulfatase A-like enzyme/Tfp pilus assembly protein PilF